MSRAFVLIAGLLAACAGCGGPVSTVQGTVTIDGQLARGGTVQFHPVGGGPTAYGSIAEDGSYAIRVGQGDLSDPNASDVPTGEYIVTVVVNMPSRPDELVGESGPPKPGARLSAEKYGDKDTSELRHTVNAGHNVVPLDLEGASADEDAVKGDSMEDAPATEPQDDAKEPVAEDTPAAEPSNGKAAPATEPSTGESSAETDVSSSRAEEKSR